MIEAGFFDLDKTVIDEEGHLYEGLDNVLDPRQRDFKMTVITARGYPRFVEAVTQNPVLAITPGMPIALEMGARIIDSSTYDNLYYHPLSKDEQVAIFDHIEESEPLRYVAFHPKESRTKTLLWSPTLSEAEKLHISYSHNADVFSGSRADLYRDIQQHEPCMITTRLSSGVPTDMPEGVSYYSRGSTVNFIPQGVDKGTALEMIADMGKITLQNALMAGNDMSDLPALRVKDLGHPMAVGSEFNSAMRGVLPPGTIYVADPRMLGGVIMERVGSK